MGASDDVDLRLRVEAALATIFPAVIRVRVHAGHVRLQGTVVSARQRQRAEALVRALPGVRTVQNDLVVGPLDPRAAETVSGIPTETAEVEWVPGGRRVAGTEIDLNQTVGTTDSAVAAEEAEPYLPPMDPVVRPASRERHQGLEILGGLATSALDPPHEAEDHPAVLQRGDDELAEDVREALRRDAATADLADRIVVTVRRGVVHLRGQVRLLDDIDLLQEVAGRVPGVVDVVDELDLE
jgi:osmotically-inducible protein OsmY